METSSHEIAFKILNVFRSFSSKKWDIIDSECSKVVGARWALLIVPEIADLLRFPCKIYLSENELKKVTIASVVKWEVRVTDVLLKKSTANT